MIMNDRQFSITRSQLKKMKDALRHCVERKVSGNPLLHEAMIEGMKSQIQELEQEIAEYEALKKGGQIVVNHLEELPNALIKARIAKNLTQKELADMLHMKPQQIQRYEQSNYQGAAFSRILQIGNILEVGLGHKR